jgi:hypothetical protein
MKTTIALAAIIATVACASAIANETYANQKAQYFFNQMDANHDGQISKAEHDAFAQSMFLDADTNHDNALSLQEVTAEKQREMSEMRNQTNARMVVGGTNSMKGSSNINLPNRTNANPTDHSMNPTNPSQSNR